jgi:hypothetical protein
MMTTENKSGQVLRSDGIQKLLEGGVDNLSNDERALLLALIGAEAESGRELSEEERSAMKSLADQIEGYDAGDLARAVEHMVKAKTREGEKLDWPDLKDKLPK